MSDVAPGLADEPNSRQPLDDRPRQGRTLLDQHGGFGVAQTRGQRLRLFHGVMEHENLVAGQPREAGERSKHVLIVVEHDDLHRSLPMRLYAGQAFSRTG